jgi:hypothetical protein
MVAIRRAPNFNMTIADTERMVAELAAVGYAGHEIFGARDHQISPSSGKQC